jgi:tRNA modification GTPase
VADLLATAPDGERLREGALLVIAGPPNAGKSSLFNALLGTERALVTEIPGTTRDAIEAHAVIDGFPFRLVDTAGLRTTAERVESLGIEVARRYLGAADVVLYCEEHGARSREREAFLAGLPAPVVEVRTKADLSDPSVTSVSSVVSVSSLTGAGLAELRRALAGAAFGHLVARGDVEPVVTRARHRVALGRARDELDAFTAARAAGIDAAVAATHLRDAVAALDELIGAVTADDVLDRVFASFCVGK